LGKDARGKMELLKTSKESGRPCHIGRNFRCGPQNWPRRDGSGRRGDGVVKVPKGARQGQKDTAEGEGMDFWGKKTGRQSGGQKAVLRRVV